MKKKNRNIKNHVSIEECPKVCSIMVKPTKKKERLVKSIERNNLANMFKVRFDAYVTKMSVGRKLSI